MYASQSNIIGLPPISLSLLAVDTVPATVKGQIVTATDPFWGTGEFYYGQANGSIRAQGLVQINPVFNITTGVWDYKAQEVPNTANLGRSYGVALQPLTDGQWGWFQIGGVCPVNSNAAVAIDAAIGVAAAGQAGANSAGKQLLGTRVVGVSSQTVVKANSRAAAGSRLLEVANSDGWFVGAYLSGTGIAAGTTVAAIDPSGRFVTLSADTTAAVNGNVIATYNNAIVFYNVIYINRPLLQGAIT